MATMNFIIQAIQQLDPNAKWDIHGENDIRVLDSNITNEQVNVLAEQLQTEYQSLKYRDDRAKNYPSINDQLDMLWHAMDNGVLPKVDTFYDAIKTVKNNYPK